MTAREAPAPSPLDRLEFIDSLRGFALFGVFAANLLIFSGIAYMTEDQRAALFSGPLDSIAYTLEQFFIENKFMGLFSFLFGISFWLFLSRVSARQSGATRLFYRRIFWLFVIGAIHGWLLWCFDVLRFYALWAILLPLFVRTPPRRLLGVSLAACIVVPALVAGVAASRLPMTPATAPDIDAATLAAFGTGSYRDVLSANWRYDWYLTLSVDQIAYQVAVFGRLLLGLCVARTFALGHLEAHRARLRSVLIVGALVGAVGETIFAFHLLAAEGRPLRAVIRRFLVESGHLGMTLAYASGLALVYLTARGRPALRRLAPLGRMALTWYLAQTLFGIAIFYGFTRGPALMGKVSAAPLAAIAVGGYVAQVFLARMWVRRFRFGPAEWAWRSLTWGERQPFRAAA
jgi:uncharacterized protein